MSCCAPKVGHSQNPVVRPVGQLSGLEKWAAGKCWSGNQVGQGPTLMTGQGVWVPGEGTRVPVPGTGRGQFFFVLGPATRLPVPSPVPGTR